MSTPSRGQHGSAIPTGLLGTLLLLAGAESYVSRHNLEDTRPDSWEWKLSGHLDRQGALALSATAGDFLRSRQTTTSGDRWVMLPAFRDWAPSFRVEDLRMLQTYLLQIGKIRR
jgi:hypothetical protein